MTRSKRDCCLSNDLRQCRLELADALIEQYQKSKSEFKTKKLWASEYQLFNQEDFDVTKMAEEMEKQEAKRLKELEKEKKKALAEAKKREKEIEKGKKLAEKEAAKKK